MPVEMNTRLDHEIDHGKTLARRDPELTWGWGTPAGQVRARRRAALIGEGAGLRPGLRVLEIGCGTGLFTDMLARTGCHITAVDISAELIAKARARGLPEDRVRFLEKSFEDCDSEGPFDAVVGSSVLHHLDIEPALARIYNLLKPGGRISFAEPNMLNPQIWMERKFSHWRTVFWYVSPDETAFTRRGIQRLAEQAGLRDVKVTPFDWLHPFTPRVMMPIVSGLGACLEKLPLAREFAGSLWIRGLRPNS